MPWYAYCSAMDNVIRIGQNLFDLLTRTLRKCRPAVEFLAHQEHVEGNTDPERSLLRRDHIPDCGRLRRGGVEPRPCEVSGYSGCVTATAFEPFSFPVESTTYTL